MRKILHHSVTILLLLVALNQCSVASSGIAVTLVGFTIDTVSVDLGYTLTLTAKVKNTDLQQFFSGNLDFGLHNNADTLSTLSLFSKPPYSGNLIFLNPGESVPAVFSIHIENPYFIPGPDVVVVWPICSQPVADTLLVNLLIQAPSGIEEKPKDDFSYIVMSDKILLHTSFDKINFKQVRIFDIMGQEISQYHSDYITEIPVPNLPKGIYLCEMVSADKKVRVIKFYH